jgi:hypothetical protein
MALQPSAPRVSLLATVVILLDDESAGVGANLVQLIRALDPLLQSEG